MKNSLLWRCAAVELGRLEHSSVSPFILTGRNDEGVELLGPIEDCDGTRNSQREHSSQQANGGYLARRAGGTRGRQKSEPERCQMFTFAETQRGLKLTTSACPFWRISSACVPLVINPTLHMKTR